MRRVRIVVDKDKAVWVGHRLHLIAISVEEARRYAEAAGNVEQQAYFEGQRDLVAALAKDMCIRETYEVEDAEIEGPSNRELHYGLPFLPIPTPKDKSAWT